MTDWLWAQVANLTGYNDTQAGQQAATDRFNDITLQLTTLSNNFSNNALDGTAAWTKLITEKGDLAGLPASFLAQAAAKVTICASWSPASRPSAATLALRVRLSAVDD